MRAIGDSRRMRKCTSVWRDHHAGVVVSFYIVPHKQVKFEFEFSFQGSTKSLLAHVLHA